jgi:hypothetical protein
VKWLAGILEANNQITPLTFAGTPAVSAQDLVTGTLAVVSIYFWGNPAAAVVLEVIRVNADGTETTLAKRSYKIDPDGSAARSVQFLA